ncbi:trafficking protein particle complex subunit 12-like isoform X2 [Physella acuta]|uniref:trafficking protein particle complex subunit 12-like isoform X2 n=1 Tax=Physella acuta TaxID=109671 RepID=UPI0027DAED93|nr:trafficking protein particle complex subunit 12-like isoform X2 [Physella acuta]
MSSPIDDFMLEDDDEESGHLQPPYSSLSSAMVSSPTTDTLDSVVLEPSAFEDVGKTKGQDGAASISSYFANSSDDIFDSLGAVKDDNQLGSDLFMSIAISKSDEDIRVSEMNATEIKDTDVIPTTLSPESEEGMRRENSFLRKREEEDFKELDKWDADSSIFTEQNEKINEEVSEVFEETEENIPSQIVTHFHHREHKSSTCEPETIVFEGETEAGMIEQADLQIADLAEEEIEEFTQNDDKPGFMSQVSRSSEHAESAPVVANIPASQQAPAVLNPPVDTGLKHQGPVVGTTPSQLSPMGTPVHQSGDSNKDILTSSPPLGPMNTLGLDAQNSVPGSPFHIPSPETKSGSIFSPFGSAGANDDVFTSILSMSDADRRHDAWIPSDATSHVLKTMATSPFGTFMPAIELLSSPGIISNEPQGDPVKDLVLRYMGEQEAVKRSVLTVNSVTQDADGLKKLIEAGCLGAAIDLTGRLLEQVGQGFGKLNLQTVHTPHSLQLWFCRFALMVKMRMYEQADAEMRAFHNLDTPDLYFQFYANTYPGRRGSMVSFSMRLLHAELPLLCGRSQESLDRLYYMLAVCNRIKSNLSSDLSEDGSATHMTYEARKVSLELWMKREIDITYKIGSTMLAVKDYEGALSIYNSLLEKDKNSHLELLAGIGRIHLQMGNIAEATRIMKEVETESSKIDSTVSCHNLINRGLVAMCGANFFDAYQHFKSAVQMQPHNTCAVNNMAVCSLYLGRLKDALNTLEQLVHSDPANNLHEGVLFNLCTLYELETSRALHKKQAILDLVSKHKGDGFPVACLKMT